MFQQNMNHAVRYDDVTYDIIYHFMNVFCTVQAVGRKQRGKGRQEIDIHLLKPNKFRAELMERHLPEENLVYDEALDPSEEYVTYPYRIAHPILHYLPMKLAQYLGDNYQKELHIPKKKDKVK